MSQLKVMCDLHRPMTYGRGSFEECKKDECQPLMAARREAVQHAKPPTEEDKARWRAQRAGQAKPK